MSRGHDSLADRQGVHSGRRYGSRVDWYVLFRGRDSTCEFSREGGEAIEFLVRIDVHLPADMPAEQRQALMAAERARGRELIARGALKRIWRIPGRLSNYSLYDVQDATELHDCLSSLPLWSWTAMQVEPLAIHPLEAPGEL